MGKQNINREHQINIQFNADVKKAKAEINDLMSSLRDVAKMPGRPSSLFDDNQLRKASEAAMELETHLNKAVNVNTGKLDLSRFSNSLKASGKQLTDYYKHLASLGPTGEKTFLKLANAVATAEAPVMRINTRMKEFATTLSNTAKWQISSSVLHGVTGELQKAIGYAQDLNESLNNIRIVTGKSTAEMAKFADKANKAAKALSSTTTEYTNAALIYYQQGLKDSEIEERAEVTLKMANVSRQSAEVVSDQMTAIWNNFDNGSKSLEYYADVIAELGAITASSSDEIAQGLEKFAAVADTVGLSYEYATAALATVTSETRQSADVVGTAFKTLFARIQDLELGKTLDDGTSLGKYSEALNSVGISIKDQHGQLKTMDSILADMGSKWGSLSKDQQVSLAQTVAGVRQYTQLIALMDNWSGFQDNLAAAENASGTLDKQAAIYAESWEAARDRVTAAAEDIYDSLLNDETFIEITNIFAGLLETIGGLVDGLGGLGGILTTVGSVFLSIYAKELPGALTNLKENFQVLTGQSKKLMTKLQEETAQSVSTIISDKDHSESFKMQAVAIEQVAMMKQKLGLMSDQLSDAEKAEYQQRIDNVQAIYDEAKALGVQADAAKKALNASSKEVKRQASGGLDDIEQLLQEKSQLEKERSDLNNTSVENTNEESYQRLDDIESNLKDVNAELAATEARIQAVFGEDFTIKNAEGLARIKQELNGAIDNYGELTKKRASLDDLSNAIGEQAKDWKTSAKEAKGNGKEVDRLKKKMADYLKVIKQSAGTDVIGEDNLEAIKQFEKDLQDVDKSVEECADGFEELAANIQAAMSTEIGNLDSEIGDAAAKIEAISGEGVSESFKNMTDAADEYAEASRRVSVAQENANSQAAETPKHFTKASEVVASVGAGVMATYAAINAVSSSVKILGDDSSTTLEKIGAAISMVTGVITALNAVKEIAIMLSGLDKASKLAELPIIGSLIGANISLGAAEGVALWPLLLIVAALAAFIAIGAAVIAGIQAITDAWNADANAAKAAQENVDEAKKAFEEATSAFEELKAAITDYNDMQDALKELVVGTKEWDEALQKSNEHVLEMLRTFPELSKYFENNDGVYQFTDTEAVEKMYAERQKAAQSDLNNSQIAANVAKNRSLRTNALRDKDIADVYNGSDWGATIASGAAIGAQAGATTGNPGIAGATALIGAAAGLGVAIAKNTTAAEESDKALSMLQSAYEEQGGAIFHSQTEFREALKGISSETVAALWNNREALEKLTLETALNTAQMAALIEANIGNVNADNEYYQSLDEEDQNLANIVASKRAASAMADPNSAEYQKARKEAEDEIFHDGGFLGIGSDNYDSYLKAKYGDDASNYRVTDAGGTNATLQKKNADGTWETVGEKNSLSNDEVLDYMASYKLQQLTDADKAEVANLQKVGTALEANGLDSESAYALQKDLADGGSTSLFGMSPEAVASIQQAMQESGSQFTQEYQNAINAALEDYQQNGGAEHYANMMAQQEAAEISSIFGAGAEELDTTEEALESYAESLIAANDGLKDNKKLAAQMAVQNLKLGKGLNDISNIYKKHADALEEADENSMDYHEAVGELTKSLEDTFGLDVDPKFVKDNLEDIQKMADGDVEALKRVRAELTEDYIMNLVLTGDGETELANEIARLSELALNSPIGTELTLDNSNAIAAINEALYTGQATIEDIEKMFNNANLQMPEYKVDYVDGDAVTSESTSTTTGPLGIKWTTTSTTTTRTKRAVPYFGDNAPSVNDNGTMNYGGGGSLSVTSSGNTATLGSAMKYEGDDSSSSSTKNMKEEEKARYNTNIRYQEYDDLLHDIEKAQKAVNRELDKMYGAGRIAKINQLIKLAKEEVAALEEKKKLAKVYLETDKKEMGMAASNAGVSLQLNEEGDIINHSEAIQELYAQLNALIDKYNDEVSRGASTAAENTKEDIDEMRKTIENLEGAIDRYKETQTLIETIDEGIQDAQDSILSHNYSKITTKMELRLELNESDLRRIERKIAALGDDLFARAEVATLKSSFSEEYLDIMKSMEEYSNELTESFEKNEISQADYIEGLKQIRDNYYENIDALRNLKAEMKEYYADTLQQGDELVQSYLDFMAHPTRVMEHYNNLLDLTGNEHNYEAKKVILEGIEDTKKSQAEARKAYYEMMQAEADKQKAEMLQYDPTSEAYKIQEAEWKAAQEIANQAEEDMLSAVEEWAQAVNDVLDNELSAAARDLEKALTNGTSFDAMNTAMERTQSLQEEWLTNTNKVYETNKMITQAQQKLDKATNEAAKQKLKTFIQQTQSLKEQEKLSKFELELQQARYGILEAELALEDAKNAKSTVRLQRDSEGNYGYVYTADDDKIAEAEQRLLDAENFLYNKGLEGYEQYSQKYQQTLNEMYTTITGIHEAYRNGEYESEEEYHQALLDAQEYYGQKLAEYTYLGNVAMRAESYEQYNEFKTGWEAKQEELSGKYEKNDLALYQELIGYAQTFNSDMQGENAIRDESWATTFSNMETNGGNWATAMADYNEDVKQAFQEYNDDVNTISDEVGINLGDNEEAAKDLKEEVDLLKQETDSYKHTLMDEGGVLDQLGNLYDDVNDVTTAFSNGVDELETQIGYYEDLAEAIEETIRQLLLLNETELEDKSNTVTTTYQTVYETVGEEPNTGDDGNDGDDDNNKKGGTDKPGVKPGEEVQFEGSLPGSAGDVELYSNKEMKGGHVGIIDPDSFAQDTASTVEERPNSSGSHKVSGTGYSGYVDTLDAELLLSYLAEARSKKSGNGGGPGARGATTIIYDPADGNDTTRWKARLGVFDTGGYTGSWGPDGRLALLHQKELVLNAADTENMLNIVSMVRGMVASYPQLIQSAATVSSSAFGGGALEQSVTIEAHFPGVQDRYEIEAALGNLINTASQFASRKKI